MLPNTEENQEIGDDETLPNRIMLVVAAGIILVFVGAMLILTSAALGGTGSNASGGVVIFIGPIPIAFGTGPDAGVLILAGAFLAAICVVLVLLWRRRPIMIM